jgi:hypothetical protein
VQHHAARVDGVANLCVPYLPNGFAVQTLMPLVDRKVYPIEQYPAGQWDYHLYYEGKLRCGERRLRGRSAGDREGAVPQRAIRARAASRRHGQRAAPGRLVRQGRPRTRPAARRHAS